MLSNTEDNLITLKKLYLSFSFIFNLRITALVLNQDWTQATTVKTLNHLTAKEFPQSLFKVKFCEVWISLYFHHYESLDENLLIDEYYLEDFATLLQFCLGEDLGSENRKCKIKPGTSYTRCSG